MQVFGNSRSEMQVNRRWDTGNGRSVPVVFAVYNTQQKRSSNTSESAKWWVSHLEMLLVHLIIQLEGVVWEELRGFGWMEKQTIGCVYESSSDAYSYPLGSLRANYDPHTQVHHEPPLGASPDGGRCPTPVASKCIQVWAEREAGRGVQDRKGPCCYLWFPYSVWWWTQHRLCSYLWWRSVAEEVWASVPVGSGALLTL